MDHQYGRYISTEIQIRTADDKIEKVLKESDADSVFQLDDIDQEDNELTAVNDTGKTPIDMKSTEERLKKIALNWYCSHLL